jgi:SpoIID/LytB domain protein
VSRAAGRLGAGGLAAVLVSGVGLPAGSGPASAQAAAAGITLAGHGWGHGIGMGQWGALGYALMGQGYQTILAHYYGNTQSGTVADVPIRVRMVENDGNDIIVTSSSSFTVAGVAFAAGQAARMHLAVPVTTSPGSTTTTTTTTTSTTTTTLSPTTVPGSPPTTGAGTTTTTTSTGAAGIPGTWTVFRGPGCAGPWTQVTTASDNGGPVPAQADPSDGAPTATESQVLALCEGSTKLYVRGSIRGAEIGGAARTVNVLPMDEYLQGVVPSESPAGWGSVGSSGPQGQPEGFQALEAQAVAARSYAAAAEGAPSVQGGTGTYGYADICDTTACQVYRGLQAETAISNLAVADTAGLVRANSSGAPVSTEFSSSTGGWTAGGPFPAVPDAGDSVCVPAACNPNHDWSVTVPAASIQSAYPAIGTFESLDVTARTGPAAADQGGRVVSLALQGSAGSVTTTGATFAGLLGLKSDWFAPVGAPSGGIDGYWVASSTGGVFSFGAATFHGSAGAIKLNKPIVGMAATPDGLGYWLVASDGGIFTFGDAGFHGSTGAIKLNKPIVGMAATPDGLGYWLVASDGGIFTFGDAGFHGAGAGTARPVGARPAPAVGLAITPDGVGYWILDADGAVTAFGDAPGLGSVTSIRSGDTAVGLSAAHSAPGYVIATRSGQVFAFGAAPSDGGIPDQVPGYSGHALAVVARPGS